MKVRICLLLCLSSTFVVPTARASDLGEAASPIAVSPQDTMSTMYPGWPRLLPRPLPRMLARPEPSGLSERDRRMTESASTPAAAKSPARSAEEIGCESLDGADGNVLAMAQSGSTLYIAGAFRSVGENSGGLVACNTRTGELLPTFPKVSGSVEAIASDGAGGWYIGGEFTGVGGKPRSCLAQIRADGTVTEWNPNVTGTVAYIAPPAVSAIAVHGDRVFVGGAFGFIGGKPRRDFGCVDAQTGAVIDLVLDLSDDGYVSALALQGDTLFVGGGFSSVGGVPRSSLAAVSTQTGEVLPWRMDVFGGAYTLLACADTLFVGGDFIAIAGQPQSMLVAVDVPRATLLPIDFQVHGIVRDYLPSPRVVGLTKLADTLYAVGNFDQIGGQFRSSIAAVSAASGSALPWQPDSIGPRLDGYPPLLCVSVAIAGPALYVGGYFNQVGGAYHPYVARWDRQSAQVGDWTPTPDDVALSFGGEGDTLLMGGAFHIVGAWKHRAGLAAIDIATGHVKPWNPNPNGSVCTTIAVRGGQIYVSGDFSVIGGDPQPRDCFAALDTLGGLVTAWDPGANAPGTALLLSGDTLYVGGMFNRFGGQPRNGLAAVDAVTGMVLPWDPNAASYFDGYSPVYAIAKRQDALYLGGTFTEMGGQQRLGLACVDAITGVLSPWNPGTDNSFVATLLLGDGVLYVGGAFGSIGGQPRKALAAVDLETGQPTAWYPALTEWDVIDPRVRALALVDSVLYVGGSFASIGGQPRICLGSVNATTGLPTDWNPEMDGLVWSLLPAGGTLYVGGGFSRACETPASGLAAFALASPQPSPPPAFTLSSSFPNPARTSARIGFSLPSIGAVTLSIYDLQGRRVARPLNAVVLGAGQHAVQLSTQSWRPGVYLYRLEAEGHNAARKMVVVQ